MEPVPHQGQFKPFEIKDNMRMAPTVRVDVKEEDLNFLDELLQKQGHDFLYLHELKKKVRLPGKWDRTWPPDDSNEVVEVSFDADVVPEAKPRMPRAKLLKFHENVRPPYWGTWQKKSAVVTARKPFGQEKLFDYEVDSDDEWEEEEPGESLSGTEDEKESEDEYEVDNEFFVPHGYLSDEENKDEDEECTPPDMQKAKLKMKELEFEEEMKKKTQQIKPKVLGCIWMGDNKPGMDELMKVLEPFKAVILMPTPISTSHMEAKTELNEMMPRTPGTAKTPANKGVKQPVPEEAMCDLIKLLHGNKNNRFLLAREFMQFWNPRVEVENDLKAEVGSDLPAPPKTKTKSTVSKRQLGKTIQEIAVYQKCPQPGVMRGKCWCVRTDVLAKYGLSDLSFPNTWHYVGEQSSNASNASILFSSPTSLPPVVTTPSVADLLNNPISYNKALTSSAKKLVLNSGDDAKIPDVAVNVSSKNTSSDASIPGFAGRLDPIAKTSGSAAKMDSMDQGKNAQDALNSSKAPLNSSGPKRITPHKIGSITKFFCPASPSAVSATQKDAKLCTAPNASYVEQKSPAIGVVGLANNITVIELD